MNAKDLLQMNDQMIAFNTLIKGDLANEVAAAKAALSELGSAQDIAGAQAKVDSDKANFETYKASVQTIFDETKASLQLEQGNVNQAFADLKDAQSVLSQNKDILVTAQDKLAVDTETASTQLLNDRAALSAAQQQLATDQASLQEAQVSIATREAAVAAKLSAIQVAAAS